MKPRTRDEWLHEIGLGVAVLNILFVSPLSLYLIFATSYSRFGAIVLWVTITASMGFMLLRDHLSGKKTPTAVSVGLLLICLQMGCAAWMLSEYSDKSNSFSLVAFGLFLTCMIVRKVVWMVHKRNS